MAHPFSGLNYSEVALHIQGTGLYSEWQVIARCLKSKGSLAVMGLPLGNQHPANPGRDRVLATALAAQSWAQAHLPGFGLALDRWLFASNRDRKEKEMLWVFVCLFRSF